MEKKNKKKLFAIIGGSVLAFVLTIALSVSITLAYFGQSASGTGSIKTGGSVLVNNASTFTTSETGLIPGQKVDMKIAANVSSSSEQTAYLVAVVNVTADGVSDETLKAELLKLVNDNIDIAAWSKQDGTLGTLEGTVYMYGTTNAQSIAATTSAKEVLLTKALAQDEFVTIPEAWDNDFADKTISVSVTFIATQAPVNEDTGAIETTVTYSMVKELAEAILTQEAA